jgi:hypothetical protein
MSYCDRNDVDGAGWAAERSALQLPPRRAAKTVKITTISRAECGRLDARVGRLLLHTEPIDLQNTPTLRLKCVLHLDQVSFSMPNNQLFNHISHCHLTLPQMDACLAPLELRHVMDILRRRFNHLLQLAQ